MAKWSRYNHCRHQEQICALSHNYSLCMCVFVNALVEICALGTHREFMLQIIREKTLTECSAERLTLAVCVCMWVYVLLKKNVSCQ